MAILSTDVQLWWDMQEGTGTSLADSSGNSKTGSITGTTWTTGGPTNLPNGLSFPAATSNYATNATDFDLSAGSISAWINIASLTGTQGIVSFGALGGEADVFIESSLLKGRTRIGGSDITITYSPSTSTLYHVVYTWSSASGTELFVNGVSQATNGATGTVTDQNQSFFIGRRSDSDSANYNGKIFQTILLTKKIDVTEVGTLYNSGSGKTYTQFFPVASTVKTLALLGVG